MSDEKMHLYRVTVERRAVIYVVAADQDSAELVGLDASDYDLDDEGDFTAYAQQIAAPPPEMLDTLPYGPNHDDPRRDWTMAQWMAAISPEAASGDHSMGRGGA